jgi:uncharacterized membrane-anchored protein
VNQHQEDERNQRLSEELAAERRRVSKLEASNKALAADRDKYATQLLSANEHANELQAALDEILEDETTQVTDRTYELTQEGKAALAEADELAFRVEAEASLALQERCAKAERAYLEVEERITQAMGGPGSWTGKWLDEACARIETANAFRVQTGVRCVERALSRC